MTAIGKHDCAARVPLLAGQRPLSPTGADRLGLRQLGHFKSIIGLNPEVPDCDFQFRVTGE